MASTGATSTTESIVNTVQDAANCESLYYLGFGFPVALRFQYTAGASKEANKDVAKDSNNSLGDRASAGIDALGDKAKETKHDTKAEGYKQSATH
ncbi:Glucose-repressible protein [Rhodotorula mucilaginosa]|uniref:Glucose-repressible protein n=1 Tax=Rhodotorula mucilaginosa TaxID=5537 RepID=A0A9P6VVQ3_RHOMI|nr:Glucose-repressible protein [Rhodotorula mucilaginosa]